MTSILDLPDELIIEIISRLSFGARMKRVQFVGRRFRVASFHSITALDLDLAVAYNKTLGQLLTQHLKMKNGEPIYSIFSATDRLRVRELSTRSGTERDELAAVLDHFPNLTALCLRSCILEDADRFPDSLKTLKLKRLTIQGSQTHMGVLEFVDPSQLEVVEVAGANISRYLDDVCLSLSLDAFTKIIEGSSNIQSISSDFASEIRGSPTLRCLSLPVETPDEVEELVANLKSLPRLSSLEIDFFKRLPFPPSAFPSSLTSLGLMGAEVPNLDLSSMLHLRSLALSPVNFPALASLPSGCLANLTSLSVRGVADLNSIEDGSAWEALGQCAQLRFLSLVLPPRQQLADIVASLLPRLIFLRSISLTSFLLSKPIDLNSIMAAMSLLPSLSTLDLSLTSTPAAEYSFPFELLSSLSQLKSLRIHRAQRKEDLGHILSSIPGLENLQVLSLSFLDIFSSLIQGKRLASVEPIVRFLSNFPMLETFRFGYIPPKHQNDLYRELHLALPRIDQFEFNAQ